MRGLRDTIQAVKQFYLDIVMLQLLNKVHTLITLLSQVIKEPAEKKLFLIMYIVVNCARPEPKYLIIHRACGKMPLPWYSVG